MTFTKTSNYTWESKLEGFHYYIDLETSMERGICIT